MTAPTKLLVDRVYWHVPLSSCLRPLSLQAIVSRRSCAEQLWSSPRHFVRGNSWPAGDGGRRTVFDGRGDLFVTRPETASVIGALRPTRTTLTCHWQDSATWLTHSLTHLIAPHRHSVQGSATPPYSNKPLLLDTHTRYSSDVNIPLTPHSRENLQ